MTNNSVSPFRGPSKALRVTLRRDHQDGKPLPLRRTPHIVQVEITRALDGGFRVQAAGAPSFLKSSELRFWPTVQYRLEKAIGSPVERISRREWRWRLARRDLAPWTDAARAFAAANDDWFDEAFEQHCLWMQGVADDMARPRAERRRA